MEVKIGVQHSGRELVLDSDQTAEQVEKAVTDGFASSLLVLVDNRGRKVIVPTDKLAYVEIGESESRRVGFGAR